MPSKSEKIDDQAVFLWICLKIAKENAGKIDNKVLGEALNLTTGAAGKRLSRLGIAIEAQLETPICSKSTPTTKDDQTQSKSAVDDDTKEPPTPTPAAAKESKKRNAEEAESGSEAHSKKPRVKKRKNAFGLPGIPPLRETEEGYESPELGDQ